MHRRIEQAAGIAVAPDAPVVAGIMLAVVALAEAVGRVASGGASAQDALGLLPLAVGGTLSVAFLGPIGAAVAVCAASLLSLAAFGALTAGAFLALLLAVHRLGRHGPQSRIAHALASGLALVFLALALARFSKDVSEAGVLTLLLAVLAPLALWAGIAERAGGEARENRAARDVIASTLVEHTARGERARIARELHDVVAHHISMVAVQAEAARLATPGMPPAGAQRLSAIGDTARAALTEMRRLLGVLREDAGVDPADRRPQPGLAQLNELLDEARSASGTTARLILRGLPVTLDPGVELAAYRIAQEALTNSRRHAPGAAVDVELSYTDDSLRLRVRDNGPGLPPAPPSGGLGLAGMRERAAAVGGRLHTRPAMGGGFVVEADLPAKIEKPA